MNPHVPDDFGEHKEAEVGHKALVHPLGCFDPVHVGVSSMGILWFWFIFQYYKNNEKAINVDKFFNAKWTVNL